MKNLNKFVFTCLLIAAAVLFIPKKSSATVYSIDIAITGVQEVPPNPSTGLGNLTGTYDDVTNILSFNVAFTGLSSPVVAAHFHGPAVAGTVAAIAISFAGFPLGVTLGAYSNSYVLTATQETQLLCGLWYINIHTSAYPGGEIRGQLVNAGPSSINISLTGIQEVPPNPTTGLGNLTGTYDNATNTLSFSLVFTGLTDPTIVAHFHAPASPGVIAPIVIGFTGFPSGVTSGFYSNTYVLTTTQETELLAGLWYVNIHTTGSPGGEIRGQLLVGGTNFPQGCNQSPGFIYTSPTVDACENGVGVSLNDILSVTDGNVGQTLTWTVVSPPANGTLNGFPAAEISNGSIITPTGLGYTHTGNLAPDQMTVQVSDGQSTAQIIIAFNINSSPAPAISGSLAICSGSSTILDAGAGYSLYDWSTGATTQTINVNIATTVTLTVTDGDGCSGNDSKTTTIVTAATPMITGNLSFCSGGSTTLDAGAGYSLYNWSTGATTQTINVNTATTVTVTVTNGPGCTGSDSKTTTVNPNPTPTITGGTSFCSGGSTTLNAGAGYSLYNWSTGATTQTINVNTATTVTVTVTDGNGCTGSDLKTTTIITAPTAAISGNNTICLGQQSVVQLSFTGTGPWSGTVSDGSNTVPFGPVGTTSTNVTVTPGSAGTHNYTVTALSDANCGTGSGSGTAVILVSSTPPTNTVGTLTSPATACSGQVSQISVNVVGGQNIQYSWNQGSGSGVVKFSNNIGGPFSNPPFLTNTNSVYAQFGAPGGSGYDICVQGINGCGSTNNRCSFIRGKVSVPGTISGSATACPNDVKPYTAGASGGATNYNWTLAGSATPVTTGQGTQNVSVTFPPAFVSGQLCVTASLACGGSSTSAARCMTITKNPVVPGAFTAGPSKVCPGSPAVIFTVPNDPDVTYSWTYPAGCTVNGASNQNSISLNFPAVYTGAPSVCVSALSACGTSVARCKTVGSYIPLQPSAIQGPSTNICNSTIQFEVLTDPNATGGYLWTNPAGTTITSGQGSNTILLSIANNFTSGNLSVIAKTASCTPGNSPARTLLISGKPNTPGTITATPGSWCSGATVHFAVTPFSPLPIYSWSTNKGTIAAGQGTAGVDINWTSGSGYVNVIASNTCGASGTKSQTFTSSCREESDNGQWTIDNGQLTVYPNPAHDMITVSIDAKAASELTLQLTDITGRIVLYENQSASKGSNTYDLGLNHLSKGVYMLDVKSGAEYWRTKVVVQ